MVAMLEYLGEDVVDGTFRRATARADGDDPVQPVVAWCGRFERDRGAEIVLRRVNEFTGIKFLHHRFRAMAHPAIGHADGGAIVGFQHDPHIQRGRVIWPANDPVRAAGQNFASQFCALEPAAGHEANAAIAVRSGADRLHAGDRQGEGHEMGGADLGHWSSPWDVGAFVPGLGNRGNREVAELLPSRKLLSFCSPVLDKTASANGRVDVPNTGAQDIGNIVRARVPLRLGLAGGGTDLSPYCDHFGGAVLNLTIDRYAYAIIEPSCDKLVHFIAPDMNVTETWIPDLAAIQCSNLPLHAGVMMRMVRDFGDGPVPAIRVTSFVDAPPGSGLGSSSALVVALGQGSISRAVCGTTGSIRRRPPCLRDRADQSGIGGRPAGSICGHVRWGKFHRVPRQRPGDRQSFASAACRAEQELEMSLITCFSGDHQAVRMKSLPNNSDAWPPLPIRRSRSLHRIETSQCNPKMKQALLRGQIRRMAVLLNHSWEAKKRTAEGISTDRMEQLYQRAFAEGAIGGKVSGAGGGGFMMFIVPPERRIAVIRGLNELGGSASGVHFTTSGAGVLVGLNAGSESPQLWSELTTRRQSR